MKEKNNALMLLFTDTGEQQHKKRPSENDKQNMRCQQGEVRIKRQVNHRR